MLTNKLLGVDLEDVQCQALKSGPGFALFTSLPRWSWGDTKKNDCSKDIEGVLVGYAEAQRTEGREQSEDKMIPLSGTLSKINRTIL